MKITRVLPNNRKRSFILHAQGRVFELPYSYLKLIPGVEDPLISVYVDEELAREGFTYVLRSGQEDSVLLDEVCYVNRDPEFMCNLLLFNLTCDALSALEKKKISKRALARQLKTSPKQLSRLLDTTFYGKTINQMVRLLYVLGHEVEFKLKKRAA